MFQVPLLLALSLSLPTSAPVRGFVLPHVLEKSGTISGVGGSVEGGRKYTEWGPGKLTYDDLHVTFLMNSNGPVFNLAMDSINGNARKSEDWSIHRILKGNAPDSVTFRTGLITEISFPACNVDGSELALADVAFRPDFVRAGGPVPVTPLERDAVKSQKKFFTNNFSLNMPGLPTGRVSKIDSFTIKQQVATPGSPPAYESSEVRFTIPVADARPFFEAMAVGADGSVKTVDLQSHLQG